MINVKIANDRLTKLRQQIEDLKTVLTSVKATFSKNLLEVKRLLIEDLHRHVSHGSTPLITVDIHVLGTVEGDEELDWSAFIVTPEGVVQYKMDADRHGRVASFLNSNLSFTPGEQQAMDELDIASVTLENAFEFYDTHEELLESVSLPASILKSIRCVNGYVDHLEQQNKNLETEYNHLVSEYKGA